MQDLANAVETIGDIAPGVLIIRDLGYISVNVRVSHVHVIPSTHTTKYYSEQSRWFRSL